MVTVSKEQAKLMRNYKVVASQYKALTDTLKADNAEITATVEIVELTASGKVKEVVAKLVPTHTADWSKATKEQQKKKAELEKIIKDAQDSIKEMEKDLDKKVKGLQVR